MFTGLNRERKRGQEKEKKPQKGIIAGSWYTYDLSLHSNAQGVLVWKSTFSWNLLLTVQAAVGAPIHRLGRYDPIFGMATGQSLVNLMHLMPNAT